MEILLFIENIIEKVSSFGDAIFFFNVTGVARYKVPFLIAWITVFGIYCTVKFRFINVRYFIKSLKMMASSKIDNAQKKAEKFL